MAKLMTFWFNSKSALVDPNSGLNYEQEGTHDVSALLTLAAAAGGTVNSSDQVNPNCHGLQLGINITTLTGTSPTVTVTIQGKDLASGAYYTLLQSAALAATGFTLLTVNPGMTNVANVSSAQVLPAVWRVSVSVAGTAPAATATVGASVIS